MEEYIKGKSKQQLSFHFIQPTINDNCGLDPFGNCEITLCDGEQLVKHFNTTNNNNNNNNNNEPVNQILFQNRKLI